MVSKPSVTHDWGRLREAVVGRVTDFVFPEYSERLAKAVAFAPEETKASLPEWAGRAWSEAQPEGFERCVDQVEGLVGFLESRGVVVHRPRELTESERSVFERFSPFTVQIFVRDPMIVIGDMVIEAALRRPHRFKERYGLRPIFKDLQAAGADYRVMPPPPPIPLEDVQALDATLLEGGDVFLMGNDVLVGLSTGNFASSAAGVAWLQDQLGSSYRIHVVPLSQKVLHLDDGLAIIDEGLAIICREQFVNGLPSILADWDVVEVTLWEALNLLAGNALVLGPGEILIDERLPHLAEQLTARDVSVHTLPYDAVTQWAGGFRCSHHPIIRERP